jgi:hypothetical protein
VCGVNDAIFLVLKVVREEYYSNENYWSQPYYISFNYRIHAGVI